MATITPTVSRDLGSRDGESLSFTYALLTASPDGYPLEHSEWADKCWHAFGTWGGATLTLQGSNDTAAAILAGTANWFTMANAAGGTAATQTADGGKNTIESPRWVRPNLTTPGVGAIVTVVLVARRHTGMRT